MALTACTIGFPRIGPNRDTKKALEKFWKGDSSDKELLEVQQQVEQHSWKAHKDAGIDLVGVDSTLYDQVLDMTWSLGLVPDRFSHLEGLQLYFAMARGHKDAPALDMSKYFNTNYHYLVPEISGASKPKLDASVLTALVKRAQASLGKQAAVPMIIGPITMARLATLTDTDVPAVVKKLTPLYTQLLKELSGLGVPEVQVLEPALFKDEGENYRGLYESTYATLSGGVPLNLVTFYDDLGANYEWVVQLPVEAVSIDFCGVMGAAVPCKSLEHLKTLSFPAGKILGAGVVDGRNVWADDGTATATLEAIKKATKATVRVQTSCSLQHVPLDTGREASLDPALKKRLAFAVQKLSELRALAGGKAAAGGARSRAAGEGGSGMNLDKGMFNRPAGADERRNAQFEANPNIPNFPTTTIGSFPQTAAIRKARADLKAGRTSPAEHERLMDCFISEVIGVQEGLGIDVFVHGEPERSDMVEYFGVSLEGFAFTEHAWVQSYGSRYVRPPIIHADVRRTAPMTVREFTVAQRLTDQPVKGMLTGPVTMLNWAFARSDVARSVTAFQLALAVREEVVDLEAAGCSIIQVDEPALREGLPLKREQWESYLQWAVDAFRLATAVAKPATQIVTHLCYSEFGDILAAIDRLDADVLTIENSRSGDAMLRALAAAGYSRDVGAGVYDVHSPVVPSEQFVKSKVESFLAARVAGGDARRIWINPDCGLKTRAWPEVLPSLRSMVSAAKSLRATAAAH